MVTLVRISRRPPPKCFGRGLLTEAKEFQSITLAMSPPTGMAGLPLERKGWRNRTNIPNSTSSAISNGVIAGQAGRRDPEGGEFCNQFEKTACTDLFIWRKKTGVKALGHLPGRNFGLTKGINAFQQVVGSSGNHAFFWTQSTGMLDLNRLVKAPGWTLLTATAINDSAQIVGLGMLHNIPHGFLLTVR